MKSFPVSCAQRDDEVIEGSEVSIAGIVWDD